MLELHEAFAGQVLSNLKALESEKFCQEKLGLNQKVLKVVVEEEDRRAFKALFFLILGGDASHGEAQQLGRLRVHWTSFRSYRWMLDLKRFFLS